MDINTLKVLDFVLFEVVEPELKPSAQFSLAKKLGFKLCILHLLSIKLLKALWF